jgi:hypothetical protein
MGERAARTDERVLCPTSGEICVARVALLESLAESQRIQRDGPGIEFPEVDDDDWSGEEMYPRSPFMGFSRDTDGIKAELQLREYDFFAKRIDCGGPANQDCPARIAMVESQPRTNLLKLVRTIFKGV